MFNRAQKALEYSSSDKYAKSCECRGCTDKKQKKCMLYVTILMNGVQSRTSAALSRFAESDALGSPNGRNSFSRPRHTGDCIVASLDRIQFKFPCKEKERYE